MDVLCRGSDSLEPCRVVLAGILQKTDTVPVDEGRAGGTREGVVGALVHPGQRVLAAGVTPNRKTTVFLIFGIHGQAQRYSCFSFQAQGAICLS